MKKYLIVLSLFLFMFILPDVGNAQFKEWDTMFDVPIDRIWTITFSEDVDSDSVNEGTVWIEFIEETIDIIEVQSISSKQKNYTKFPVNLKVSSNTIIVEPKINYKNNNEYVLYIDGVKSKSGKNLKEPIMMKFITEKSSNTTKPEKPIVGKITVKYVNLEGVEIFPTKVIENLELREYAESAIFIDGYSVVDDSTKFINLTIDNPEQSVIFVYNEDFIPSQGEINIISVENNSNNEFGIYLYSVEGIYSGNVKDVKLLLGGIQYPAINLGNGIFKFSAGSSIKFDSAFVIAYDNKGNEVVKENVNFTWTHLPSKSELLQKEYERHELAVKEIKEKYNAGIKFIDDKIKEIRWEYPVGYWSDYEYERLINDLQERQLEISRKIDIFMLDDSDYAKAKRFELQKELEKVSDEIEEVRIMRSAQLQIRHLEELRIRTKEDYEKSLTDENQLHREKLNEILNS